MGPGRLLAELARSGWSVAGVDSSPGMVELARARLPAEARLKRESAERLSWSDGEFDAAVAIAVLEYTDVDASLRELARVVRTAGRVLLSLRRRGAPVRSWRHTVAYPLARRIKRRGTAAPPPMRLDEIDERLSQAGLRRELMATTGAEVLPDPLDRLLPGLAFSAARAAERRPVLRDLLGSDRLIVARRR